MAAEAEVERAVMPDLDLQGQMESATDSSSELAAAAVVELGCSEGRSGAKPETRRAASPCVEPLTVAASEALRGLEGPEDAASAAAVVARVAVPEQLGQLGSVASVEAALCVEAVGLPFVHFGRQDFPASVQIAEDSCLDGRSYPCPYPCHSSAAAVAAAAAVVAGLAALPSSAVDEPGVAAVASSIGGCWPLRRKLLASI